MFGNRKRKPTQAAWKASRLDALESRDLLAVGVTLDAGALEITGTDGDDVIEVDISQQQLVVRSSGTEIGSFDAYHIWSLKISGGAGNDQIVVSSSVYASAKIEGGDGDDSIQGGSGASVLIGGAGNDYLSGGSSHDRLEGGDGDDSLYGNDGIDILIGGAGNDFMDGGNGDDWLQGDSGNDVMFGGDGNDRLTGGDGDDLIEGEAGNDQLVGGPGDDQLDGGSGNNRLFSGGGNDIDLATGLALSDAPAIPATVQDNVESTESLTASDVSLLMDRAEAATASNDAIIVVVDRNGRILGTRAEAGIVAGPLFSDPTGALVFAVDGAVAKARTAAYFANNGAPLTSRSIQFISQSTITQREVESTWNTTDETVRGPGYVAPIGIGGHFPPVSYTPTANLFEIEHTNRDGLIHPGPDGIIGTPDDIPLSSRFDANVNPGKALFAPESFGASSNTLPAFQNPDAQPRGIATLPGGIPLYKNGQLVGGIGVFFPGATGYANEENSSLSADYDPTKLDRSYEAEYIAFVAAGGSSGAGFSFGAVNGVAAATNFDLPFGRIDVDGIKVPLYGPLVGGAADLVKFGKSLGVGTVGGIDLSTPQGGLTVSTGWIVGPTAGGGLTAADVEQIINQGILQAMQTRAAIRLNQPGLTLGASAAMTFAVTDTDGNILGLYRMADSTVFSIDVAVAKARNVSYYSDPNELLTVDQIDDNGDGQPDVPKGVAFTNRTFRYAALPFFPSGIDGTLSGPFSILRDGQASTTTGLNVQSPLPRSAFTSELGHDSFYPQSNFHDPQVAQGLTNGVVFFPGSSPLYKDINGDGILDIVGGLGVSGDGVDQDDVVTRIAAGGFAAPTAIQADQYFVRDIRLPYTKFSRNSEEGVTQ